MAPIHKAAKSGNLEEVKRLVDEKPSCVDRPDVTTTTPLDHACSHNHLDVASYLLDQGAEVDSTGTMLRRACARGELALVQLLVSRGAEITPYIGSGALCAATSYKRRDVVEYLLTRPEVVVGLSTPDHKGFTALWYALGDVELVRMLMEAGADPYMAGLYSSTILSWAKDECRTVIQVSGL